MLKDKEATIFMIANGVFMGTLIMAGIVASKLVKIGPFEFDAGLLVYALTFIVTDIVTEIMGKKYAVRLVKAGLVALCIAFLMTQFALSLPQSTAWEIQNEYEMILGAGSRVFIAALISYIISPPPQKVERLLRNQRYLLPVLFFTHENTVRSAAWLMI